MCAAHRTKTATTLTVSGVSVDHDAPAHDAPGHITPGIKEDQAAIVVSADGKVQVWIAPQPDDQPAAKEAIVIAALARIVRNPDLLEKALEDFMSESNGNE